MPVLVAAEAGESLKTGFRRAFPDQRDGSGRLPTEDVARLTNGLTGTYAGVVRSVHAALAEAVAISPAVAMPLAREPCVLITHLLLDRILRLHRATASREDLSVAHAAMPTYPSWGGLGAAAASSKTLNQALLSRLAPAWNLPASAEISASNQGGGGRSAQNLNFDRPGLFRRALWKTRRLASRGAGRIPVLGLAYAEAAFLDAGLIGPRRLADLHVHTKIDEPAFDAVLRKRVFGTAGPAIASQVAGLLRSYGLPQDVAGKAATLFVDLLAELFPATRLEGARSGLADAADALTSFAGRPLVTSEVGGDATAFKLAAARSLGMPIIGVQHGAHYGFVSFPCHIEAEHSLLDRFVTWGWTSMPDHPLAKSVEAIPLPSPWLSERRRRWRRTLPAPSGGRPSDVLLMTERIQRFPATMNTVRLNRLDALDTLGKELSAAVIALTGRKLKVLHKPFNQVSASILSDTVERLAAETDGRYRLYDRLDKGLTGDLLGSVSVVIWDEPGSGIFECLVSGIPALLYWTRSLYSEDARAEADFKLLEDCGIVHRDAESLASAAAAACADPVAWLADPERAQAIQSVCRRLAWTEDDWAARWRRFIDAL